MTAVGYVGICNHCQKESLAMELPVVKDSDAQGQSVLVTEVWCMDCIRQELHPQ